MAALFLDDLPVTELTAIQSDIELVIGRIDVFDSAMTVAESETFRGSRRADFSSGRRVARLALERQGFVDTIERADRRPVWPAGAVGSITHAAGRAIAIVAHACDYRGIGIDLEALDAVSGEVAERIAAPHEHPQCTGGGALIFSAKEAIYKAVNPIVGEYLPFRAVEIGWDLGAQSFSANTVEDRPSRSAVAAGQGRFQRVGDCWLTVFTVAR